MPVRFFHTLVRKRIVFSKDYQGWGSMRRFRIQRGRRVRRRAYHRGRALLAFALVAAAAACVISSGGALASLARLVSTDFFATALAAELERGSASESLAGSLLDAALAPVVSLASREELVSVTPHPSDGSPASGGEANGSGGAASLGEPGSDTPNDSASLGASGNGDASTSDDVSDEASPSPAPSREPNAADLDPNIRTVSIVPSTTAGYDYADGVYIKNGTNYEVDVSSFLEAVPEFDGVPRILIVHTHASEAYYPEGDDLYEPTDTERTEDTDFNVVRVGDELAEALEAGGFEVTHIREIFDYPSYNGSYERTLEAIEDALDEEDGIQIVIDLHRDAIEGADGSTWRVVSEQEDGTLAAQSMLVVGTDEGGLKHPEWRKNLLLAVHLQKYIIDRYPTLMRPIALSPSRYNQHATSGSLILEVGTSGNTLDEALVSARLIGEAMGAFLGELSRG